MDEEAVLSNQDDVAQTTIAELEAAVDALQKDLAFLHQVFDAIQDGVSVLDRDLNVLRVNRWMETMYADQMPLVGQKCYAVYQQRDTLCPWCPSLPTIETGEPHSATVPYPGGGEPRGWIELSAFPVKNQAGEVVSVVEHVKDITERVKVKRALEETAARRESLERIINHSPAVVFLWRTTGRYPVEFVSDNVRQFGYTPDDFYSGRLTYMDIVHPGDRGHFLEDARRYQDSEQDSYEQHYRIVAADGSVHWVEDHAWLMRDEHGVVTHHQGIVLDVTRRHETEVALRQSDERYRNIIEAIPVGIHIYRLDDDDHLVFVEGNPAADRIMEMDSRPLVGMRIEKAFPGFVHAGIIEAYRQVATQGISWYASQLGYQDRHVNVILEVHAFRILPRELGLAFLDITRQKQVEREQRRLLETLRRRSTQLQTAAAASKAASTILDPEQLIIRAVHLIQERFGFYYVGLFLTDESGEYAVLRAGTGEAGRRMLEVGHRLRVGNTSMIGWCIAHGKARIALDVGEEAIRFDNPLLPETRSEMALPLLSRGRKCIGALTVQSRAEAAFTEEDIAVLQSMADQLAIAIENASLHEEIRRYAAELEQRVAERTAELAAVNKELEAFAYSVSHDLRAPLRSMDGFSQALLEDYGDVLDETGRDYLRRVRNASQRMGQLIDDLLTLSRVTRREMHFTRVDLTALARSVARELREMEPERKVEVVIQDGLLARGDPRLMTIVLENLLNNAWKFTGKREEARIEFGSTLVDGGEAYYVRDNGAGFDMAYADKLFGAFQRLHRATEFPGTGVGLATVQRIIHRHGGRVWAEGAVGQGATFYFTLPSVSKEAEK